MACIYKSHLHTVCHVDKTHVCDALCLFLYTVYLTFLDQKIKGFPLLGRLSMPIAHCSFEEPWLWHLVVNVLSGCYVSRPVGTRLGSDLFEILGSLTFQEIWKEI